MKILIQVINNKLKNNKMRAQFFRIAGRHSLSPLEKESSNPQKLTQNIIKNKKYVYIDINQQNGLNMMEKIEPADAQLDKQKLGKNYICNLRELSPETQNTIDYIYKLGELRKIKDKYKTILKDQIRNKHSLNQSERLNTEKFSTPIPRKKHTAALSQIKQKVTLPKQINSEKLKEINLKRELQNRNKVILEKEKFLINKYGMTNQYQTITDPDLSSPIVRTQRKIFLPEISSTPSFHVQ